MQDVLFSHFGVPLIFWQKFCKGAVGSFSRGLGTMPQIFPHFFWKWVSPRSVGGALQLIQCPPNLHIAFNNIISEVHLTHLTQSKSKTPKTRSLHCKFKCILGYGQLKTNTKFTRLAYKSPIYHIKHYWKRTPKEEGKNCDKNGGKIGSWVLAPKMLALF